MSELDCGQLILEPSSFLMSGYNPTTVDNEESLHHSNDDVFSRTNSTSNLSKSSEDILSFQIEVLGNEVEEDEGGEDPDSEESSDDGDEAITNEAKKVLDGLEETIQLPDHLQSLVDQALKNLEDESVD